MASQEVATAERANPLVQFREQLEQRANELKMVLPSHISPEKFQRTVLTAAQQNPDLLGVDRRSLILACMKAAQDGLLPDGREAAIIPFKENKKVGGQWQTRWVATYMPMVYGLRKKILQSGDVISLEVGIVYRKEVEAGHFYYEVGRIPPLGHRPMLELTLEDTTDDRIVGAYSIATMKDGSKSYEFMRRFELDKVQNASQTGAFIGRDGNKRQPAGPWKDWYPEMVKKTVVRRHSKMLPMSGDVIVDVEGREEQAGISAIALLDSQPGGEPQYVTDESGDQIDTGTGEIIEADANSANSESSKALKKLNAMAVEFSNAKTDEEKAAIHDRHAKWISDLEEAFPDIHEAAMRAIPPYEETEPKKEPARPGRPPKAETPKAEEPNLPAPTADEARPQDTGTDELGVTKDPAQIKAEEIEARFRGAQTIIDLERVYKETRLDRAAMPDEIFDVLESAYKSEQNRLYGSAPAKQPEHAQ